MPCWECVAWRNATQNQYAKCERHAYDAAYPMLKGIDFDVEIAKLIGHGK